MISFIIRRLILLFPVLLGVTTLVFFLIHLIPGDPVELMLGDSAFSTDKAQLREQLGLNQPLYKQYSSYLQGLFTGNLGDSIHSREPVSSAILETISRNC